MKLEQNVPLADYTTFKIGGPARYFCIARSGAEVVEALSFAHKDNRRALVIGGGSNVLISDAGFSGVVIKNEIMGKALVPMGGGDYRLTAGAGESWDEVVQMAVENDLHGIENLSAIPGTIGAAPVQNIGAYGVEIANSVITVRAVDTKTLQYVKFSGKECKFGYRDSIFKHKKGRYIILQVDLRLKKKGKVNIEYKDLKDYFAKANISKPTIQQVRDAVIDIRWHKLPDWKLWGTAGSFFKNPVISKSRFDKLKAQYPALPGFPEPGGKRVKVSLGWILDNICHVKGTMVNNVGSYERQALVIIAKQPGATAAQVVARTKEIAELVEKMTTIKIEAEVEWVN
ncbi:MAG TPA: UDP-N-acetylmuramate dehydrogenase [Candidatus Paceibacterota bacterium]